MIFLREEVEKTHRAGLYRSLRKVNSAQGPEIFLDGKKVLNFCSNDYLSLANDPRLVEGAIEAARKYGAGSGAARLISGNFDLEEELEARLAEFKGTEAALLFNSGYHANIGVIPALAGEGDVIFSDELNHASLIDGCRLSKAEKVVYRHNDLDHLEELLKKGGGGIFIITEAVFGMEGDLCPLDDLLSLAKKYDAILYLDEAHAVGVFGQGGQGLAPKNPPENLICMGTLGKAFGSYGAFVAGSKSLKEFLINRARSFIFSTGLPPAVIGASLAALKIIKSEPERRERLWNNIKTVGAALRGRPVFSPIFSIRTGDAKKTMEISRKFLDQGIYLQGIRPPTVPEGTSRLRLTVSAGHTEGQLKVLTEAVHGGSKNFS